MNPLQGTLIQEYTAALPSVVVVVVGSGVTVLCGGDTVPGGGDMAY